MASTEEGREEFKAWMEPITHMYSKGMATVQESAVSKVSFSQRAYQKQTFLVYFFLVQCVISKSLFDSQQFHSDFVKSL